MTLAPISKLSTAKVTPAADTASQKSVRGYRPELDVVRFLAFLLVFFHHFLPTALRPEAMQAGYSLWTWSIIVSIQEACGMGLCLFFALSAYLITSILLAEREKNGVISVRKFYVRRILRIWPLYFFGISIGIGIALLAHRAGDVTRFLWMVLLPGLFYPATPGLVINPMQILWSISIEEQFYLFWPWGMRYLRRRGLQLCAILLIVVANLTLFYLGHLHAEIAVAIGGNSFVQFEMFATGILLALANRLGKWHSAKMGALLALSGPILWFVACFEFHVTEGIPVKVAYLMIGYGLVALGCAAVLQGFCMMGSSNMPQWVANLGKISYGLYVFHMLGILFANAAINPSGGFFHFAASVLLALVLTIATAVISYAYFETPFLRLKRHFEIMHTRPI